MKSSQSNNATRFHRWLCDIGYEPNIPLEPKQLEICFDFEKNLLNWLINFIPPQKHLFAKQSKMKTVTILNEIHDLEEKVLQVSQNISKRKCQLEILSEYKPSSKLVLLEEFAKTRNKEFNQSIHSLSSVLTETLLTYPNKTFVFASLDLDRFVIKIPKLDQMMPSQVISYHDLSKSHILDKKLISLTLSHEQTKIYPNNVNTIESPSMIQFKIASLNEKIQIATSNFKEKLVLLDKYMNQLESSCCDQVVERDLDIQIERCLVLDQNLSKVIHFVEQLTSIFGLILEMLKMEHERITQHHHTLNKCILELNHVSNDFLTRITSYKSSEYSNVILRDHLEDPSNQLKLDFESMDHLHNLASALDAHSNPLLIQQVQLENMYHSIKSKFI